MSEKQITKHEEKEPIRLHPPVDIFENEDEFLLVSDVAGVEAGSVNVELEQDVLSIEAKRSYGAGDDACPVVYERTFLVPAWLATESIDARLESGTLSIHLKKAASSKPRKIAVGTA